MRNKIIQSIYVFCFFLVSDSYSQVGFIKDSIPGDYSSIVIDDPKFQVRLVGIFFDNLDDYQSDKSVKYKYLNKVNDTVSSCSYSFRSVIDSIQIKVSSKPSIYNYSYQNCFVVKIETFNDEQIYFKDGIEFVDNVPISLIPNHFKYKVINGVSGEGYCHTKLFNHGCVTEESEYVIKITQGYKTHFIGHVKVTCP